MPQTGALVTGRAQQQNVGDGHRAFLLDDAALDVLRWIGARVPLDHAGMLDHYRALGRIHTQHTSGLAAIAPGHHPHLIAFPDSGTGRNWCNSASQRHYQTSGASETIFANFFSRNSRATGPNTRVPTGSLASLISTAALSSKRM